MSRSTKSLADNVTAGTRRTALGFQAFVTVVDGAGFYRLYEPAGSAWVRREDAQAAAERMRRELLSENGLG